MKCHNTDACPGTNDKEGVQIDDACYGDETFRCAHLHHRDCEYNEVSKFQPEHHLAPVKWWCESRRIYKIFWQRFNSVPDNVMKLPPTAARVFVAVLESWKAARTTETLAVTAKILPFSQFRFM